MDLSIIIVNWNTRDLLHDCLRSIEAGGSGIAIQTIVVDNNSADASREMVAREHPAVELMNSGGNLGFARANNLALPRVRSPLVLFLNPDTIVTGAALRRMVDCLQSDSSVGVVGCRIVDAEGRVQQLGIQWFPSPLTELLKYLAISEATYRSLPRLFPWRDPETSGPVAKLFGACLLVRESVLRQVGSFDERFFMYCEDVDLCYRVSQAGWKLYYTSDAEIIHLGAASSAKAPGAFAVLMGCESFVKFMRKHHGRLGSAAYRGVALLGAHLRLGLVLLLRLAAACRLLRIRMDLRGATRKYWTIIRWALGLQKPVIRE